MAGTRIEESTDLIISTAGTFGDHYVPLGIAAASTSIATTINNIVAYAASQSLANKIFQLNSSIEVVDTGTGHIEITIDGTELFRIDEEALYPAAASGGMDLGTSTKSFGTLYLNKLIVGSDATGDIYYRADNGTLERLGIGASTEVLTVTAGLPSWETATSGGGSTDSRWTTWTGFAITSDNLITNSTTVLEVGTPIRFSVDGGSYNYGIVESVSTSAHTINGYNCTTATADAFEYGTPELVTVESIIVTGAFADGDVTAAASGGLLYDDLLMNHLMWNKAKAYLVQTSAICMDADGSTAPSLSASISSNGTTYNTPYSTLAVGETVTSTASTISANYLMDRKSVLDFNIVNNGDGDAKNLTVYLTFIQA